MDLQDTPSGNTDQNEFVEDFDKFNEDNAKLRQNVTSKETLVNQYKSIQKCIEGKLEKYDEVQAQPQEQEPELNRYELIKEQVIVIIQKKIEQVKQTKIDKIYLIVLSIALIISLIGNINNSIKTSSQLQNEVLSIEQQNDQKQFLGLDFDSDFNDTQKSSDQLQTQEQTIEIDQQQQFTQDLDFAIPESDMMFYTSNLQILDENHYVYNLNNTLKLYDVKQNKDIDLFENQEEITTVSRNENLACICLETKIVLIDLISYQVKKTFETKAKPQTSISQPNQFQIGNELNNEEIFVAIQTKDFLYNYYWFIDYVGASISQQRLTQNNNYYLYVYKPYKYSLNSHMIFLQMGDQEINRYHDIAYSSNIKSKIQIIGETEYHNALYYNFEKQSLQIFNADKSETNDGEFINAKLLGLNDTMDSIISIELHPNFSYQKNNYVFVFTDKQEVKLRKVEVIKNKKMSLPNLKYLEDKDLPMHLTQNQKGDILVQYKENRNFQTTIRNKIFKAEEFK